MRGEGTQNAACVSKATSVPQTPESVWKAKWWVSYELQREPPGRCPDKAEIPLHNEMNAFMLKGGYYVSSTRRSNFLILRQSVVSPIPNSAAARFWFQRVFLSVSRIRFFSCSFSSCCGASGPDGGDT